MLLKTMTYTDYDGNERTEDFYFNISKAEQAEMHLSTSGGLDKLLNKIIQEKDAKRITEMFKEIITMSYGEKSADGKRFIKSQEIRDAFVQTEAYSDLFMLLATDADAAASFVNAVFPKVDKQIAVSKTPVLVNN